MGIQFSVIHPLNINTEILIQKAFFCTYNTILNCALQVFVAYMFAVVEMELGTFYMQGKYSDQ